MRMNVITQPEFEIELENRILELEEQYKNILEYLNYSTKN